MKFEPKTLDYKLSPYTGFTRESWMEAGKYLLEGIFQNIATFEDPVVMPRKETKITYPHLDHPESAQEAQRKAEKFEGLDEKERARTQKSACSCTTRSNTDGRRRRPMGWRRGRPPRPQRRAANPR